MAITIYSLGDHESIRAALTGVAMIFDPAKEMLGGSGMLGLGQFAGFGLLVSFMFVASGIVLKQKMEFEHVLFVMLAYAALFVPKTTVQIEDMHTGAVAVVDNIPVGVAYPGGIISTFTRSVAVTLEQVMKDANSSYIPQTDVGFVAPLKLMLALRNTVSGDPYFAKSFTFYVNDCVSSGVNLKTVANLTDPALLFDTMFNSGNGNGSITMSYKPGFNEGQVQSCTDAALDLRDTYTNLISGADPYLNGTVPESTVEAGANAVVDKKPGTATARWSMADMLQATESIAGAGVNAQKIATMIATADLINNTFDCGKAGTQDYISCTAGMSQAMEGYKFDAAGGGTMFQKTMIPTMNVFMFFFYAFSPLVAILVAMSGMKGLTQILPGYMLFGVWTQSWIPAAAIINYFIQKQTSDAVIGRLVAGDGIPLANMPALYQTVSLKIAAASDLLASAPMVTLALMSGSIFALSNLASKGADRFDEKTVSPEVSKVGAATNVDPMLGNASHANVSGKLGTSAKGSTSSFSVGFDSDAAKSYATGETAASEQSWGQHQTLASSAGAEFGKNWNGGNAKSFGNFKSAGMDTIHGQSYGLASGVTKKASESVGEGNEKQISWSATKLGEFAGSAMVAAAAQGLAGKSAANFVNAATKQFAKGQLPKLAAAAGQAMPDAKVMEKFTSSLSEGIDNTYSANKQTTDQWTAKFSDGTASKDEQTFAAGVSKGYKNSFSKSLGETKASAEKHANNAAIANTTATRASGGMQFSDERAGHVLTSTPGGQAAQEQMRAELIALEGSDADIDAYQKQMASQGRLTGSADANKQRAAAIVGALLGKGGGGVAGMILAAAETGTDNTNFMQGGQKTQQAADTQTASSERSTAFSAAQKTEVANAAGQASKLAGTAQANASPGVVEAGLGAGERAANQQPTIEDHNRNSDKADDKANESGINQKNRASALGQTPMTDKDFAKGRAKLTAAFEGNHQLKDLAAKFGEDMLKNNKEMLAIAAVGGSAAVASALTSISKAHMGQFGGGGMSLAEYGKKVLQRLGTKVPGLAAKAGAKTVARVAGGALAGSVVPGVGTAAVAAAMTVYSAADTAFDLGAAVYSAIKEENAAQQGGAPPVSREAVANSSSAGGNAAQQGGA